MASIRPAFRRRGVRAIGRRCRFNGRWRGFQTEPGQCTLITEIDFEVGHRSAPPRSIAPPGVGPRAKARGVKLGGMTACSIRNHNEAKERAKALRPVLAQLAGMSARAIAAELSAPSGGP